MPTTRTPLDKNQLQNQAKSPEMVSTVFPQESSVICKKINRLFENLEGTMDSRGARRIFLSYVEPPLKDCVPELKRKVPEVISNLLNEVLAGNIDELQRHLAHYFQGKLTPAHESAGHSDQQPETNSAATIVQRPSYQ